MWCAIDSDLGGKRYLVAHRAAMMSAAVVAPMLGSLAGCASASSAGPVRGIVSGEIRSTPGDSAVAGARVRLVGAGLSAVTDPRGRFRIEGVPHGRDQVAVAHDDHATRLLPPITFPGCGQMTIEIWLPVPRLEPEPQPPPTPPPPGLIVNPRRLPTFPIVIVDARVTSWGDSAPDLSSLDVERLVVLAPGKAASLYGSRAMRGAYVTTTTHAPKRDCPSNP
jgi:hypothetical protein